MINGNLRKKPVLIANRGEIAIRVARSCRKLGMPVIGVYSEADRDSEHLRYCDAAYEIGEAAPQKSYLSIERVLKAAQRGGAGFIHPGYGFLSERPEFALACEDKGIVFVGPTAKSMSLMGDKITARKTVDELGVPRVPGSAKSVANAKEAAPIADEVGYPVLLKASAGGGGKGMRRVNSAQELDSALQSAQREALSAFGDDSVYIEKLIEEPHHVEIQVFGDGKGKAIHLGERECSIQRRHQKVWEETPSPILEAFPDTRKKMEEAAIRIAEGIQYRGAGTLEFIVDGKGNFYFLEMNTRLQVEHPVTEWVTRVDLVEWQLRLAMNDLTLPDSVQRGGASVEVRIYAEDPHQFLPAPGSIGLIQFPSGPFVRVDSAFVEAGEVSSHYDPMIAKISVWGNDRSDAVARMRVALDECRILPPRDLKSRPKGSLRTNLSFLQKLVRHSAVLDGNTTTDLIPSHPELTQMENRTLPLSAALAGTLFQILESQESQPEVTNSIWNQTARTERLR